MLRKFLLVAATAGGMSITNANAGLQGTPSDLIVSPAGKTDTLFEAIETPSGFLVTFARSTMGVPPFTYFSQRFTAVGSKIGGLKKIGSSSVIGRTVELARTGKNSAAAVWYSSVGKAGLRIGKLNLETGEVKSVRFIGRSDDQIHDVVKLSNGNIAVVTSQFNRKGTHQRLAVKILTPRFSTVKDWFSVNGKGFNYDPLTYGDQTIVAKTKGAIVLYRDRATNKIKGRNISNSGKLGTTVTVSTTGLAPFSPGDINFLEVKGARLSDGRIAACWVALNFLSGHRFDVRCRLLNSSGTPVGSDFLVHADTDGFQTAPEVVALPGGLFLVTWSNSVHTTTKSIMYRTFNSAGLPLFAEREATFLSDPVLLLQTEAARLGDGTIVNIFSPPATAAGVRGSGIASPVD